MKFLVLCLFPIVASAGLLRVESNSYVGTRKNEQMEQSLPMYEFLEWDYSTTDKQFTTTTNFSYFSDPFLTYETNEFELYIFDFSYAANDTTRIRGGRQFNQSNLQGVTSDTISVSKLFFEKKLRFEPYFGQENERGNLSKTKGQVVITGMTMSVQSRSTNAGNLTTNFQRKFYRNSGKMNQDQLQIGGMKSLDAWNSELLFNTETLLNENRAQEIEVGTNFYPNVFSSLLLRMSRTHYHNEDEIEAPISSIFSYGEIYHASTHYSYLISKHFQPSLEFSVHYFPLYGQDFAKGYKSGFGFISAWDYFKLQNNMYFLFSYGGKALGNTLHLTEKLSDLVEVFQEADITYYEKITNSKRSAIHTGLGLSRLLGDNFKLSGSANFDTNNSIKYDIRGFMKLTYLLWKDV